MIVRRRNSQSRRPVREALMLQDLGAVPVCSSPGSCAINSNKALASIIISRVRRRYRSFVVRRVFSAPPRVLPEKERCTAITITRAHPPAASVGLRDACGVPEGFALPPFVIIYTGLATHNVLIYKLTRVPLELLHLFTNGNTYMCLFYFILLFSFEKIITKRTSHYISLKIKLMWIKKGIILFIFTLFNISS